MLDADAMLKMIDDCAGYADVWNCTPRRALPSSSISEYYCEDYRSTTADDNGNLYHTGCSF